MSTVIPSQFVEELLVSAPSKTSPVNSEISRTHNDREDSQYQTQLETLFSDDLTKSSAQVIEGLILILSAGLTTQARKDVFNTVYLSLRSADTTFDRFNQFSDWSNYQSNVLSNLTWNIKSTQSSDREIQMYDLNMAMADFISLIGNDPSKIMIDAADTLMNEPQSKASVIIENYSIAPSDTLDPDVLKTNRVVLPILMADSRDDETILLYEYLLFVKATSSKTNPFKWSLARKAIDIKKTFTNYALYEQQYAPIRNAVEKKVKEHPPKAIATIKV